MTSDILEHLHALLLCGGKGTRLWPESRGLHPKQTLALDGERALVAATAERIDGLVPGARIRAITDRELSQVITEVLALPAAQIIGEDPPRGTAPAILLGARAALADDPDAIVAALPADHLIAPASAFRAIVTEAAQVAASGELPLVLLGFRPTAPATGYGYIQRGAAREESAFHAVLRFHEKPAPSMAWRYYLDPDRGMLWNSGIFIARADRLVQLIETHARDESISFDHGVLERMPRTELAVRAIAREELTWSDIGSWAALPTAARRAGDVIDLECRHTVLRAAAGQTIVAFGLDRIAVVQDGEITLVAALDRAEDMARLRAHLRQIGREELL